VQRISTKHRPGLNLVKQFLEIQGLDISRSLKGSGRLGQRYDFEELFTAISAEPDLVKLFLEIQGLDISTPLRPSGRLGQRYDFEELFTAIEQHVNNF